MKNTYIKILVTFLTVGFSHSQYDLDDCGTDIAGDVPQFFHDYFECVTIRMSESGDYINLYFNGTPPYESWYYQSSHPNNIDYSPQGPDYYKIPNATIQVMDYVISIPTIPTPIDGLLKNQNDVNGEVDNNMPNEYPMGSVGSALNGVNMFNPCAAPPDIIEDEAYSFDLYSAHPAGAQGIYHYHTTSPGPLEVLEYKNFVTNTTPGSAEIELYGIMCDGTIVMGCTELDGSPVDFTQVDAQHGHVHDIINEDGDVLFEDRYHTHMCFSEITEDDTNGNGYEDHEFTPESSYYQSMGSNGSGVCAAMSEPHEPDAVYLSNEVDEIPTKTSIVNVFPNPFNPETTVNIHLDLPQNVNIDLINIMGKSVESILSNTYLIEGEYSFILNGENLQSGIYFINVNLGNEQFMKKIALIK